jgi:hypothetical protein
MLASAGILGNAASLSTLTRITSSAIAGFLQLTNLYERTLTTAAISYRYSNIKHGFFGKIEPYANRLTAQTLILSGYSLA